MKVLLERIVVLKPVLVTVLEMVNVNKEFVCAKKVFQENIVKKLKY
jgi:hypothetical protein